MLLDANTILSGSLSAAGVITGQAVTATGNTVSTNVYDLGVGRDLGKGEALEIAIQVTVAPLGGTTVQFALVESDDAAVSVNPQVIVQTDAFAIAVLTAGTQVPLHWDRAAPYVARRYISLRYTLVGTFTAGSYFANITKSIADPGTYYANGFAVL